MIDNTSAFNSFEYDRKIRQTMPYYEEYYRQIIELVKTVYKSPVNWLDIGCGTGMMGAAAFDQIQIKRFIFMDSSEAMINLTKERFSYPNAEFIVRDVRDLSVLNQFDVVTAVQVFHFLDRDERSEAVKKCYEALKENGSFIYFENTAPFTETGREVYLDKWKRFQIEQGKSLAEAMDHIDRYGRDYYPITIEEHLHLLRECGFKAVEVLWFSNMQAGFWGMK